MTRFLAPLVVVLAAGFAKSPWGSELLALQPSRALDAILLTLIGLGGTLLLGHVVALAVRTRVVRRSHREPPGLLVNLAIAPVWLLGTCGIAVVVFDVAPSAAFTTSGVMIAVVGFAVRHLVADLFYGLTLAVERPFEIGDWIHLRDGLTGRVDEMTWRAVKLITRENLKVAVPNSQLAAEYVVNYDQPEPSFRSQFLITLGYDVGVEQVSRILLSAVQQVPETAELPNHPEALVDGYEERGVIWKLRFWLPDFDSSARVTQKVHEALLRNLHFAGISIPRPRQEVLLGALDEERAAERLALHDWIHRIELFSPLPPDERNELQVRARRVEFEPECDVVTYGEDGDSLFVIQEGALQVWIESEGIPQFAGTMGPGQVFGEMSLLTGAARSASVRAETAAVVHEITKADLEPALRDHPELAQQLASIVARRSLADANRDNALSQAELEGERRSRARQIVQSIRNFFKLPSPARPTQPDTRARPPRSGSTDTR